MSDHYPIVGAHFRPPAQALLNVLSQGFPLFARREPSNPFDPQAVQVLLNSADLRNLSPDAVSELDQALPGYGLTYSDLFTHTEIHLGYVPKIQAQFLAPALRKAEADPANELVEWPGTLTFGSNGKPAFLFTSSAVGRSTLMGA